MKTKNFEFGKYCTPAQLYLVLGMIGIIGAFFNNYSIETLLTNALFLVVWTWVLNWLCSKGFKAISWILVLLPFIMALFTYFFIKDVLVVREGATIDELYAQSEATARAVEAEIAAAQAINKAKADAAVAKVAKAAAAAAFEAENKRRQEAMKQQQQALAAMQAASAAAINN